jgi:hypothetical protein
VVVPAVGAGQARAGSAVGESAAKQSPAFAKCSLVLLVAADLGKHRTGGAHDQQEPKHSPLDIVTISASEPPNDAPAYQLVRHAHANPAALHGRVVDADIRDVADLSAELHGVKSAPFPRHRRAAERLLPIATRVPGVIGTFYALLGRSVRLRQRSGTVTVTAIGMFAQGGGFALTPLTLMSLQVVVGGISERPHVVKDQVEIRSILDLTVSIDHNVVDGGPAARFGAELRRQIESAEVLNPDP